MSSTTIRSGKLYRHLNSFQLANIAQGYIANNDSAELKCIIDSLPVYTYRAPSRDYFRAIEVNTSLARLCSIAYWQALARARASHGLALNTDNLASDKLPAAIDCVERGEQELNTIKAAWCDLCELMNWDRHALNHIPQMPINNRPSFIDADYYAELIQAWESVLDSAGISPQ